MIRINLLAVERERGKKKIISIQSGHKMTLACGLILVSTIGLIGWRYMALDHQSKQVDADIAAAQQETVRLHSIIQRVQQFEQQKAALQQRVVLIEQLRKSQTGPVHMLDEISRALPQMLWLTELKQTGTEVLIDGKCLTLTGLSDFVSNLEGSGFFKKSVEIVSSQSEAAPGMPGAGELIKFTLKAVFQQPGEAVAAATPAKKQGD
jgi:type IV pilus assembly protein PilN